MNDTLKVTQMKFPMKYSALIILFITLSSMLSFRCDEESVDEESIITLSTPNGGEQWQVGTTQLIQWTSKNITGNIKIEISTDDGISFTTLFAETSNDGTESWYITGSVSATALLRISSREKPDVRDESDGSFAVVEIITGPSNLQANVIASHDIELRWQDRSTNESGFIIERKTGFSGAWDVLDSVSANVTTYTDPGLGTNRQFFYRVRAYSGAGISGETAIATKILGWIQQESNTTQTLFGVSYYNATSGIVVGQGGTILRTTNGGDEWGAISSGTTSTLAGVAFFNTSTGVAVGSQGTILRTNNGGEQWTLQIIGGTNYHFTSVDFATANDVYVVGYRNDPVSPDSTWGVIFRSSDSGINWGIANEQRRYVFEGVAFGSQDIGTVVGSVNSGSREAIFRTTNRGLIWSKQSNETSLRLKEVSYFNANTATIVGFQGTIFRTVNGGASWSDQSYSTLRTLHGVGFGSALFIIAVGDDGTVLRTTDGGDNWTSQSTPTGTTRHFNGLFFNDANTITIVGSGGLILKTNNAGVQ